MEDTSYYEELETTPEPTYGEKIVGISFNQSNDPVVDKLKSIFAEAIDIVKMDMDKKNALSPISHMQDFLSGLSIGEILKAQMSAVKAVTYRK